MTRAQHLRSDVAEDVYSDVDVTIDLTDSVMIGEDATPRISISLRDAASLRAPAAGLAVDTTGSDTFGRPRDLVGPSVVDTIPAFLLRRSHAERRGVGILSALYRAADLLLASVALLAVVPLMLAAAIAVKIDSPGPVFYRHQRFGRNGKPIGVLKFRSMVVDADRRIEEARQAVAEQDGKVLDAPTFKSEIDPRVTRVGRFLRRSGIDEIPQLFNVITGAMSVVGPRPLVADEVELLSMDDADLRHSVRPGITCLWQVFRTENTTWNQRMEMDLLYVKHRSMLLYVAMVLITPLALFRGRGAC